MKTTVFLLIALLLTCTARAAEKIEGAFGFKLGQVFMPKTAAIPKIESGFENVYMVTPEIPNPAFAAYYVHLTPLTHLIYEIIAVGPTTAGEEGIRSQEAIKAFLQAKYGTGPLEVPAQILQPEAVIDFFGQPGTQLTILYRDITLYVQNGVEASQVNAARQADHVRELLKKFDGKGM